MYGSGIFKDSQFHDSKDSLLTQALFYELVYDKQYAIYTLNKEPRDIERPDGSVVTLQPIKTIYLDMADVSEYEFATTYFYDWDHWQRCLESNARIAAEVEKWRYELELKLISQGMQGIITEARSGGRSAMAAQKWLAERGWDKTGAMRGRPKNKRRAKVQDKEASTVLQGHFSRMQD